jgi:sugar O-acyltransferase (sialic acid O-acetyltransferase NeuD family)
MKRLAILGASGHGKVIADAAEESGWDEVVFFDDAWPRLRENGRYGVAGDTRALMDRLAEYQGVMVGIGNNAIRLRKHRTLAEAGGRLATIVHPSARVSRHASLGEGTAVMANAVINTDTRLGLSCIVNTGATVDHDCVLGDVVHVCPGAHVAGGVRIGDASWIGIGSCVRQSLAIGGGVMVGAGAAVVKDIGDGCTVVGVPARVVRAGKEAKTA